MWTARGGDGGAASSGGNQARVRGREEKVRAEDTAARPAAMAARGAPACDRATLGKWRSGEYYRLKRMGEDERADASKAAGVEAQPLHARINS